MRINHSGSPSGTPVVMVSALPDPSECKFLFVPKTKSHNDGGVSAASKSIGRERETERKFSRASVVLRTTKDPGYLANS